MEGPFPSKARLLSEDNECNAPIAFALRERDGEFDGDGIPARNRWPVRTRFSEAPESADPLNS